MLSKEVPSLPRSSHVFRPVALVEIGRLSKKSRWALHSFVSPSSKRLQLDAPAEGSSDRRPLLAMAMAMDPDTIQQLLSIGQQYVQVEKEKNTLAEQLKTARKRRRQLAAEVRFLHEKLRSFQRVPELDGPSQAARRLKSMEAPQFYEVEVKFANSLESGMMDSMVFEYPPSPRDSQIEFAPDVLSRQDKLLGR